MKTKRSLLQNLHIALKNYQDFHQIGFTGNLLSPSPSSSSSSSSSSSEIEVESLKNKDGYAKCPRCLKYHQATLNFDSLCNRCVAILLKEHPEHESIPLILANLVERGVTAENNPEWDNID